MTYRPVRYKDDELRKLILILRKELQRPAIRTRARMETLREYKRLINLAARCHPILVQDGTVQPRVWRGPGSKPDNWK